MMKGNGVVFGPRKSKVDVEVVKRGEVRCCEISRLQSFPRFRQIDTLCLAICFN